MSQKEKKTVLPFLLQIKYWGIKLVKFILGVNLLILLGLLVIDALTSYIIRDKIYTDIKALPQREYALVLGTAKFYSKDVINEYYKYRLDTATQLIKNDKVDKLLVSGDNKTPYYNEPKTMTNDLKKMGVSSQRIKQDYAGYTTFDSMLRAKLVYKLPPFTIVSQKFHCERALLIAKFRDIDAICYAAKYPEGAYQVRLREILARGGMLFNLLFGKMPETLEDVPSK
ncbi:ElyC/SanA/YdcF family protein [Mannheimia sp. AT1]|uniref:ElyC/SanA/YdcF family protein n=1 Tax=Mannheimia cairinae TaxID=3025936 RepID=A0ABT5MSH2_9PAST|nr:ElyC/SanA/YdcF family protein [Mannheimia cairinae]MDD0824942.1 ElyC/SanA/YdcF family protein [Mannheimia cairinae]MDD0826128.1 ElyC/SanA/YdcF family protein [Mannheimia cairinae]